MKRIYLDYAATTPVDPQVIQKMLPLYTDQFGNPSSIHSFGRDSQHELRQARHTIADCLNCSPKELIFTSGGTESDNLALLGTARKKKNGHIITTTIEHTAVLASCKQLEKEGFQVTYVPVDAKGTVALTDIEKAIRANTVLISVMFGNNEVGSLQPIMEIGELARQRGILFHVDAVQALGSVPIDLKVLPVDLASFSAHKIYGPKGVGFLYVSEQAQLHPLQFGGNQERAVRGGTENAPGIVGMAEAVRLAVSRISEQQRHGNQLKAAFIEQLTSLLKADPIINGSMDTSLPHILNISFPGISAETMLMNLDLDGIAAASGSACTSGSMKPSHVLQAMGLQKDRVQSAIRFSFGKQTTLADIRTTSTAIASIVNRIRK